MIHAMVARRPRSTSHHACCSRSVCMHFASPSPSVSPSMAYHGIHQLPATHARTPRHGRATYNMRSSSIVHRRLLSDAVDSKVARFTVQAVDTRGPFDAMTTQSTTTARQQLDTRTHHATRAVKRTIRWDGLWRRWSCRPRSTPRLSKTAPRCAACRTQLGCRGCPLAPGRR